MGWYKPGLLNGKIWNLTITVISMFVNSHDLLAAKANTRYCKSDTCRVFLLTWRIHKCVIIFSLFLHHAADNTNVASWTENNPLSDPQLSKIAVPPVVTESVHTATNQPSLADNCCKCHYILSYVNKVLSLVKMCVSVY